jgi:hypothetical protein
MWKDSTMKWWSDFLAARASAIDGLRDEGKEWTEIARILSCDSVQVTLIYLRNRSLGGAIEVLHDQG